MFVVKQNFVGWNLHYLYGSADDNGDDNCNVIVFILELNSDINSVGETSIAYFLFGWLKKWYKLK